jgi:ATP-dependent DNA ligase
VVKGLHTPYVSDSRSHWYKIKPDYVNEVEPMDVVVLGGYFRQGSLWSGSVSRFLVGIAIDDPTCLDNEDGQGRSRRYYAFAKVASGLNTQERQRLDEKLSPHWIDAPADGSVPPWLSGWHPTKDDRPARFIEPHKSVILEVRGAMQAAMQGIAETAAH